jgi:hypothetical protein
MLDGTMGRARRLVCTALLIVAQALAPAHPLARAGGSGAPGEVCTAAGIQRAGPAAPLPPGDASHAHAHCPGCPPATADWAPPAPTPRAAARATAHTVVERPAPGTPVAPRAGPWARGPPADAACA